MKIFEVKGRITPASDKTNLAHRFVVPEGVKRLIITYSYSPKTLADREKAVTLIRESFKKYEEPIFGRPADYLPVKNLITLSLDDNGKYRGAAHRQASEQQHIISEDFASPGFTKGRINGGEWDIVLNIHYIGCDVDYKILVEGEAE